jgi:probable F420-dependent oxidoreductase
MHIGVMAHFTDLTPSPAEVAIAAEERGFESLFVTEHTHIPVREFIEWWGGQPMPDEYKRLHDPLIALATAASVTSRIKLGTGVLVMAQREPIATGKQLASLDRLSGGRLVCGVGYGWEADELADHGISWSERKPAFREHMQAIRALWADDESSYHGDRVRFGPCWSYPKPLQQPGPPVLLGAVGTTRPSTTSSRTAMDGCPLRGPSRSDRSGSSYGRSPIVLAATRASCSSTCTPHRASPAPSTTTENSAPIAPS